jgi:hypothetical protein
VEVCGGHDDCKGGEFCHDDQQCHEKLINGKECGEDGQCNSDKCMESMCRADLSQGDQESAVRMDQQESEKCNNGECVECRGDGECDDDKFCDIKDDGDQKCHGKRRNGKKCDKDSACKSDKCMNGRCAEHSQGKVTVMICADGETWYKDSEGNEACMRDSEIARDCGDGNLEKNNGVMECIAPVLRSGPSGSDSDNDLGVSKDDVDAIGEAIVQGALTIKDFSQGLIDCYKDNLNGLDALDMSQDCMAKLTEVTTDVITEGASAA